MSSYTNQLFWFLTYFHVFIFFYRWGLLVSPREFSCLCARCSKGFLHLCSLRRQYESRHNQKHHTCTFCRRQFNYKGSMLCHIKNTHPGVQPKTIQLDSSEGLSTTSSNSFSLPVQVLCESTPSTSSLHHMTSLLAIMLLVHKSPLLQLPPNITTLLARMLRKPT